MIVDWTDGKRRSVDDLPAQHNLDSHVLFLPAIAEPRPESLRNCERFLGRKKLGHKHQNQNRKESKCARHFVVLLWNYLSWLVNRREHAMLRQIETVLCHGEA